MKKRIPYVRWARPLIGLCFAGAALAGAPAAHAQAALPVISSAANIGFILPASAAALAGVSCTMPVGISGKTGTSLPNLPLSKAAAITNGGAMTALERMIRAQSGQLSPNGGRIAYGRPAGAVSNTQTSSAAALSRLVKSSTGLSQMPGIGLAQCMGSTATAIRSIVPAKTAFNPATAATDFLGSKRIKIGKTSFEKDWRRVSRSAVPKRWAQRRIGIQKGSNTQIIAAVNAYANRAIRFTEDRNLWGKPDYWASAKTTFRLGMGDCEDIAIAKMQMLHALGIKREDMVLTLAKDLVRRVDHAVLIVKLSGKFVMLDNTTDKLIDASVSQGYRPVLSFGKNQSWLHGF